MYSLLLQLIPTEHKNCMSNNIMTTENKQNYQAKDNYQGYKIMELLTDQRTFRPYFCHNVLIS